MKPFAMDEHGNLVRVCAFCGRAEEPSKEHLFAKQWRKHFPDWSANDLHDTGWLNQSDGSGTKKRDDFRRRQGEFTRTASRGAVCEPCNSGWMSQLEDTAVPILVPMAKGESPELTAEQVKVIELWTAKTAVVAELMDEGPKAFDLFQTGLLKEMEPGRYSPQSFYTDVKAIYPPRDGCSVRSSILSLHYRDHECTGHHIRATTIMIGAVALVAIHAADARAGRVIFESKPWTYLGDPPWNGRDGWTLDRSSALSFEDAVGLNDLIRLRLWTAAGLDEMTGRKLASES